MLFWSLQNKYRIVFSKKFIKPYVADSAYNHQHLEGTGRGIVQVWG